MGKLDEALAPLFFTMLTAVFLTGIVSMQTYNYWKAYKKDWILIRIAIFFLWITLLGYAVSYAMGMYNFLITHYGDVRALGSTPVAWKAAMFMGHLNTYVVKIVFIYRLWKFSSNPLLVVPLLLLECFSWATSLVMFVATVRDPNITSAYEHNQWAFTCWFISETVLDWSLTACLAYEILKSRSRSAIRSTRQILDRLLSYVLTTGLIPSIFTLSAAIAFHKATDQSIWLMLYASVTGFYVNALLFSLNSRAELRKQESYSLHISSSSNPRVDSGVHISTSTTKFVDAGYKTKDDSVSDMT